MKFSNKDLCSLLFSELSPTQSRCNTCLKIYKNGNGYTNQVHHLLKRHPDYHQLALASYRQGNRFGVAMPDQRTSEIYRWIEWCVMDRMPVSFCERPLVRKNTKMEPISAATLQKYLDLLYVHVRSSIAATLPEKFGIVLDGWSSGGQHFVAIMAVYDDPSVAQSKQRNPTIDESIECLTRRFTLLAFCPLENEEDLGAQSLYDLIADTLSTYEKPWKAVLFMIGDNCSVNQSIGRKVGALPFVGCASHRFQLAVNEFLANENCLLAKIQALMKHLSTIKCRAVLRKVTPLAPVQRNATRWSSTFSMVQRYVKLNPALTSMDHATITKHDIASVLLSQEDSDRAHQLLDTLMDLHEVSKALQDPTMTIVGARRAFDWVSRTYPSMKARLAPDATIVNHPALESGIAKIIVGARLTAREQEACKAFKRPTGEPTPDETSTRSFLVFVFKKSAPARTQYMSLAWVPPTSNECERFFSQAKLVLTDMRKSMDVDTLEVLMFLAYNRDSWDVGSVQSIRRNMRSEVCQ